MLCCVAYSSVRSSTLDIPSFDFLRYSEANEVLSPKLGSCAGWAM